VVDDRPDADFPVPIEGQEAADVQRRAREQFHKHLFMGKQNARFHRPQYQALSGQDSLG